MSPIPTEARRRVRVVFAASLLVFSLGAWVPLAADPSDGRSARAPDAGADEIALPDPERIRRDERLRELLSRSHRGLVVRRGPDGSMSVDLQGRFQSVSTAHVGPDGQLHVQCLHDHEQVIETLTAGQRDGEPDPHGNAQGDGDDAR